MERIDAFLPSILIIAAIACGAGLYVKWTIKHFGGNFNSVEWQKQNQWKVILTVSTPIVYVLAPAAEELTFRMPLIIAFSTMSLSAWYAVLASSGLFALMHWFGRKIFMWEILDEKAKGNHKSDNVKEEIARLHAKTGKRIIARKVIQVVATLVLGILTGYYGIKYQSIWVAFGIHFAWNLIVPALPSMVAILLALLVYGVSVLALVPSFLRRKVRRRQRMSW